MKMEKITKIELPEKDVLKDDSYLNQTTTVGFVIPIINKVNEIIDFINKTVENVQDYAGELITEGKNDERKGTEGIGSKDTKNTGDETLQGDRPDSN